VKAPATRTATSGKPASAASRSGAAAGRVAPTSKSPAKAVGKVAVQSTSKAKPKATPKAPPITKAKPVAPAKGQPADKRVTPAKGGPKAVAKVAPQPVVKSPGKATSKAPVKPAAKTTAKPAGKAAAKPVAKPIAAPAAARPAAKPAAPRSAQPNSRSGVSATAVPAAPVPAPKASSPAPAVIEPSPKPLGKRAAKKIMMEQMTQAAVVPSHAPDAAKATFFTLNQRPVMTPSVPSSIQKDPKRANNWKSLPVEQLTDQDILSMPDSEYMNDVQLAYFRRKLSQLKADMLANAGETTEHLREDTVVVPDPADRATIEEEHALELRTRDRERKLLKKIEQAIARIDAGDYGYCDETGEPIGVGRLMARPTASLSLEAQQRRELKQKMFGD
jgi:DnaK suppressor protein